MVLSGQVSQHHFRGFRFEEYWFKLRGFTEATHDPPHQSAFIQSRSIKLLHTNKDDALMLKLDIVSAFHSVSWGFFIELMQRLGFGRKWCDMISLLWCSSSSRVMVNDELGDRFFHQRGLRQGDLLSLMLFTIAIAPLHWMLLKASSSGPLSCSRLPPSQLRVSLYADHAALFVAPTARDIEVTRQIPCAFGDASGLRANLAKSGIYPIGCLNISRPIILQQFPIPVCNSAANTWAYLCTSRKLQ
ncbi:hypothetical protein VPH35_036456 [Triticum aestivum]|uniref:Reverse transcriptase domain-containing protein n=1 Tax=Aegilops tauschii subsp. strangulata TaxID=200361 RepID=A0A453BBV8_AEGTS